MSAPFKPRSPAWLRACARLATRWSSPAPFAADGALIDALIAAIADHDAAVPQAGGSLQPLCALWRREPCLKVAEELLAAPRAMGPRAILPLVRAARLEWADIRPFLDADTPQVLRELELGP